VREEGIITGVAHGFFEVATPTATYLCTLRGRLRKSRPPTAPAPARRPLATAHPSRAVPTGSPRPSEGANEGKESVIVHVSPGDAVVVTPLNGSEAVIEDVLPRRNVLTRAHSERRGEHIMLANLDHVVPTFAVREPEPHVGLLDRYLALCEHTGVDVTICLNKVDLGMPEDVAAAQRLYEGLGYRVLLTSVQEGEGLDALRERLRGRTSLLTGPSGVGKSSLINRLLPGARQRIGDISEATGRGRHTTTGVRLLPLEGGGWLADSAGIRELALWNVPAAELAGTFRELRPYVGQCDYEDCEHGANEEGCALRRALAEGAITPQRFASFERLLAEAREAEAPEWER
jgi:ribosome biogenesis GTPase